MISDLKAPFPWFGGKRSVAPEIWKRFGNPAVYIEPFCGSAAVLLARPKDHAPYRREIINDANGEVVNAYRAIKADPEAVWHFANDPPSEIEIRARRRYLNQQQVGLTARLQDDPQYFDARLAGWWVYGACFTYGSCWIGQNRAHTLDVYHRRGVFRTQGGGLATLLALADRLRDVYIFAGDWKRSVKATLLGLASPSGHAAVLLDPPYLSYDREKRLYGLVEDDSVAHEAYSWAVQTAAAVPSLRIAYCTYREHFPCPEGWSAYFWKTRGGFGNLKKKGENKNRTREAIYFSPSCLNNDAVLI